MLKGTKIKIKIFTFYCSSIKGRIRKAKGNNGVYLHSTVVLLKAN